MFPIMHSGTECFSSTPPGRAARLLGSALGHRPTTERDGDAPVFRRREERMMDHASHGERPREARGAEGQDSRDGAASVRQGGAGAGGGDGGHALGETPGQGGGWVGANSRALDLAARGSGPQIKTYQGREQH